MLYSPSKLYNRLIDPSMVNIFIGRDTRCKYLCYVLPELNVIPASKAVGLSSATALYIFDNLDRSVKRPNLPAGTIVVNLSDVAVLLDFVDDGLAASINIKQSFSTFLQEYTEGLQMYYAGVDTEQPSFRGPLAVMFCRTMAARAIKAVNCTSPFNKLNIGEKGNLLHCCYQWLPYYCGNILHGEFDTIFSRIIRVSFFNHTYSFCRTHLCPKFNAPRESLYEDYIPKNNQDLPGLDIDTVDLAHDPVCNLTCLSCRNHRRLDNTDENMAIAQAFKEKLMPNLKLLTLAGNGEVFLGKSYLSIFEDAHYPDMHLRIQSNGTLFSPTTWARIEGRFGKISLNFSIDAATENTYAVLRRGGNWKQLLRNMDFAAQLRREGRAQFLHFCFVVSRYNFREIPDFVRWGKALGCDQVSFTQLEKWGKFNEEEFRSMAVIHDGVPERELENVLKDPMLDDPIVNIANFHRQRPQT